LRRAFCPVLIAGLIVLLAVFLTRATTASGPEWVLLHASPLQAVGIVDGTAVLIRPALNPGHAPVTTHPPKRLGQDRQLYDDDRSAYRWLCDPAGEAACLAVVSLSPECTPQVLDVVWSVHGEAGFSVSGDKTRVAYVDRREDELYVYDVLADSVSSVPVGDPGLWLETARSRAPEGWSFNWVTAPSITADGDIIFGSNRYDLDFADGLSLWMVSAAMGSTPELLWPAGDFGSGGHLEYIGKSPAGHLVYEARSRAVFAASEPGGPLVRLLEGVFPVSLSPDGRWLAGHPRTGDVLELGLVLIDLADGTFPQHRVDCEEFYFNDYVVWNPSGNRLAFIAPDPEQPETAQLAVVDVSGSTPRVALYGQPGGVDRRYPPSWASELEVLVVDLKGRTWLCVTGD